MHLSRRMQLVQQPIIPIVGELIRQHPGTISLGQGVVHFGPPPQAAERIGQFLADPQNHKYKSVEGIPQLVDALGAKLLAENGIRTDAESRIVVAAGGNMAFFNALLAIADPGDEIILLSPYYFNHEMAVAMLNCRSVRRAAGRQLSDRSRCAAPRGHRPHPGDRHDLAQQPQRRRVSRRAR